MTSIPIIDAYGLRCDFGTLRVLDVPSFQIAHGGVTAVVGPNGAGKSTLIKALATLLDGCAGEIRFKGAPVVHPFEYRRRIAAVFQDPLLFQGTVAANVGAGLRFRGLRTHEITSRVEEYLRLFGIAHLASRPAHALSGGEAQRTSLARAFAVRPDILFLDEPFAALDPPTRDELVADIERILRSSGTTTILATHDRTDAIRLADSLAVMRDGRIVQHAPVDTVLQRPANEFVASFVGVENMLVGRVVRSEEGIVSVRLPGGMAIQALGEAAEGADVFACVRPEHVAMSLVSGRHADSVRNELPGRVSAIVRMGHYYRVIIECGLPVTAYLTAHSVLEMRLAEGMTTYVSFKATAVHILPRHEISVCYTL